MSVEIEYWHDCLCSDPERDYGIPAIYCPTHADSIDSEDLEDTKDCGCEQCAENRLHLTAASA